MSGAPASKVKSDEKAVANNPFRKLYSLIKSLQAYRSFNTKQLF